MKLAAAYYRVSTKEQDLQRQIDKVRDYAVNNGFKIVAEFSDKASGTIPDREAFIKLQEWVQNNPDSTVIAAELDRLDRGSEGWAAINAVCLKYNVTLSPLNVPSTGEPTTDRLMRNILHEFAAYERAIIVTRMFGGRLSKLKHGVQIVGRMVPLGYDYQPQNEKQKIVVNEFEAGIVQEVFELYADKDYSLNKITRYLSEKKYKTKTGKDYWHPNTVKAMLCNEAYVGRMYFNKRKFKSRTQHKTIYRPREEWIELSIPPIIEKTLFERVQKLLKRPKHRPHNRKYDYLLTGIIECGKCGKRYNAFKAGNGYMFYRCSSRERRGNVDYCRQPVANANRLDPLIWQEVRNLVVNPDKSREMFLALKVVRSSNLKHFKEIEKNLTTQLTKTQDQINRAFDAYSGGIVDYELYATKNKELQRQKKAIEEKLAANRLDMKQSQVKNQKFNYRQFLKEHKQLAEVVDSLNFEGMQALVKKYVGKVVVKGRGKVTVEFMFHQEKNIRFKTGRGNAKNNGSP